jgi:hypothetical protein
VVVPGLEGIPCDDVHSDVQEATPLLGAHGAIDTLERT